MKPTKNYLIKVCQTFSQIQIKTLLRHPRCIVQMECLNEKKINESKRVVLKYYLLMSLLSYLSLTYLFIVHVTYSTCRQ